MSKQTKIPAAPAVVFSAIAQKAFLAAMQLNNARDGYWQTMIEIENKLLNGATDLERARSNYHLRGEMVQDAQNTITFIKNFAENMRLDMLVKHAAEIEIHAAVLNVLRPMITEAHEIERLAAIEAM